MSKIKKFITADDAYKKMVSQYTAADGLFALSLYVIVILAYYFLFLLMIRNHIYLVVPFNLMLIALCVLLVLARKQKLDSIGITLGHLEKPQAK
jgi:hypothetical protein